MLEIKNNDISSLKDKECYILFYFTASWCGPCKRIKPLIEKLSEGLDSSKIEFYMININENEELANTYNIKSVPTFLFIHKNELKDQCSGADINKVHKLLKDNMK
tara:strand:- start:340 stop:654 length:315 start_codon:yes stop_codon:yes gene_type:complete